MNNCDISFHHRQSYERCAASADLSHLNLSEIDDAEEIPSGGGGGSSHHQVPKELTRRHRYDHDDHYEISEDVVNEGISLTAEALQDMLVESDFLQTRDSRRVPVLPFSSFDPSEIRLGPKLGQGEFGTVREVRRVVLKGGHFGSMRVMGSRGSSSKPSRDLFLRSTTDLFSSASPSIASLYEDVVDEDHTNTQTTLDETSNHSIDTIPEGSNHSINTMPSSLSKKDKMRLVMEQLQYKNGHARYAVKKVREGLYGDDWIEAAIDLAREATILSNLSHPNIICLRGKTGVPGHPDFMIIMDRLFMTLDQKVDREWKSKDSMHCTTVWTALLRGPMHRVKLFERLMVAYDISRALNFLHHHKIIFRDLKPQNIGFDVRGNVRLFDFGLAKELKLCDRVGEDQYNCTPCTGTLRWMAPEVVLGKPYGLKADVYTFGLMAWYICTMKKPYGERITSQHHRVRNITAKKRPAIPGYIPKPVNKLIRECWDDDCRKRPTLDKVVRSLVRDITSPGEMKRSQVLMQASTRSLRNALKRAGLSMKEFGSTLKLSSRTCSTNSLTER